jgi:hypothetical protein
VGVTWVRQTRKRVRYDTNVNTKSRPPPPDERTIKPPLWSEGQRSTEESEEGKREKWGQKWDAIEEGNGERTTARAAQDEGAPRRPWMNEQLSGRTGLGTAGAQMIRNEE